MIDPKPQDTICDPACGTCGFPLDDKRTAQGNPRSPRRDTIFP